LKMNLLLHLVDKQELVTSQCLSSNFESCWNAGLDMNKIWIHVCIMWYALLITLMCSLLCKVHWFGMGFKE
jgi:hypothetical protein